MAINTVGIGLDTSAAAAGADDYVSQTAKMRAATEQLRADIKQAEGGINDFAKAARGNNAAEQAMNAVAEEARKATGATAGLNAEMQKVQQAAKGGASGMEALVAEAMKLNPVHARELVNWLRTGQIDAKRFELGIRDITGTLPLWERLKIAASGVGDIFRGMAMYLRGVRTEADAAAASVARVARSNASGGGSGIGSGSGMLQSALSGAGSAVNALTAMLGIGAASLAGLGAAFLKTADDATLFDRKIRGIADVPSEIGPIRSAIMQIAETTRSSLTEVATDFSKFFGIMKSAGNDIQATTAMIEGYSLALKIGGASTTEAHRASVQFFQGVAKGKWELQDLKSMLQSSPFLIKKMSDAFGAAWPQMYETIKEGGDVGRQAMSKILTALANGSEEMKRKFSEMPKTIGESIQGLKNSWFLFVEDVNRQTNIGKGATSLIDDLSAKLRSPAFSQWTAGVINNVTSAAKFYYSLYGEIFNNISSNATALFAYFGKAFPEATGWASDFAKNFGANMSSALEYVKNAWLSFFDFIGTNIARVAGMFSQLGSASSLALSGEFSKAWDSLKNVGTAGSEAAAQFRAQRDAVRETNAALAQQANLAAFRASELAGFDNGSKGQQFNVIAPPSVDKKSKGPLGEDSLAKKLAVLKEQNEITNLLIRGEEKLADEARVNLEIAKAMTPEQRRQNQALAEQIDAQIRIKEQLRLQKETYDQLKGMFTSIGDSIYSPFAKVGEGSLKFKDAMKQVLADMIKIATQALIIKPLIESFSSRGAGALTSSGIFGDSLTKGGGGLFGGFFDQLKTAGSDWKTTVTDSSNSMSSILGKNAESVGSTFTTSALTSSVTEKGASTVFAGQVDAAGARFQANVAAAGGGSSFGGGSSWGSGGSMESGFGSETSFEWSSLFMKNGGAFSNGIRMFANGDVFNSPTAFGYSGGMGVMGEAGPEAIMPLTRMPGGKLGVQSAGGGNGSTVVNANFTFNVAGDMTEETRARIRDDMRAEITMATPQIVKSSVSAVGRENTRNPTYMRR